MPVYRVLFRSKFSSVSSHIIKCLLTEFGGASAENIWLGVMKKRPRCARSVGHDPEPNIFSVRPYHSINKCTVFRFCTSHFHHSGCNWTWKMKSFILFFNKKCQALVYTPLKGLIFITRSITVQPKFLFFKAKLSLRDNRLSVFVNFSFSSGCDLHDWRQNYLKKTKWLYFGLARHTFITNDGYKIIEVVRTLL